MLSSDQLHTQRATTSVYYRGYTITRTHLAPFRARTVRTMHNSRLIHASLLAASQFPLPRVSPTTNLT